MAAEQFDGVFVAVLGVNGFAAAELDRLAADAHLVPDQADEMHLDPALVLIVEGAVAEIRRVERAGKLAIDAQEQVEVERRRDALAVVIGAVEHIRVLDEIDADDEQRAWAEHRGGMAQQRGSLVRLEIPDRGARKEADARPRAQRHGSSTRMTPGTPGSFAQRLGSPVTLIAPAVAPWYERW